DVGVDVLQGGGEGEPAGLDLGADGVEGLDDLAGLVGGEQADLGEHAGVGLAGAGGVAPQPAGGGDGLGEGFHAGSSVALGPATPGLVAHGPRLWIAPVAQGSRPGLFSVAPPGLGETTARS